ncbi:MAG TPA: LysM domain-containing protein [Sandaracinaceae bacterium LLY-WYZ-13_1]|nr:LysM domain-containing protein [Sandaracinaceae bacterium LLY-WYZ-13_1]
MRWRVAILAAVLPWLAASSARADGSAYVHVVRPGETLASIAQRYYGDPRRESVLVAENGLTTQGGAAIVVGLRLVIPWVSYHRVTAGETWAQIATQHYGDPRRVSALIDANPQVSSAQPDEGAEILVPYPLRHVARQNDTMQRVAQLYYDDSGEAQRLMRFNSMRRRRLARGRIVLVPLADLVLSEEGRQVIEEATGEDVEGGELRALQTQINEELPSLRDHVRRGRYTEAVSLGNRLLGAGELTGNQIVTIQRELAVAYIALERSDLAVQAFTEALRRQPDLEMDSRDTSPIVLRALEQAQEALAEAGGAPPASDAGVTEADAGAPSE